MWDPISSLQIRNFGSKLGSEIQVLGSVRTRYDDHQQKPSHLWAHHAKQGVTTVAGGSAG